MAELQALLALVGRRLLYSLEIFRVVHHCVRFFITGNQLFSLDVDLGLPAGKISKFMIKNICLLNFINIIDVKSEKMNADTLPKAALTKTPSKRRPDPSPQLATPVKAVTPAKSLRTPIKPQTPKSVSTIQTPTPNKLAKHPSQGTLPKPTNHARAKSGTGGDFTYARTKDSEFYLKLRSSQIDHDPRRTQEESDFYHNLRSTQIQDQTKHTQHLDQ